jgi:hypothetical protein
VVTGLEDPSLLPGPRNFPLLSKLDPQIARLVLRKKLEPLPDFTMNDLPDDVREAIMDPIAAEMLLVTAQARRIIELLEIAVVRRDYVGAENATRGLAMRIAGVALLSMEGSRARQEFCSNFLLQFEWNEITRVLTSKDMELPEEDTKERTPL